MNQIHFISAMLIELGIGSIRIEVKKKSFRRMKQFNKFLINTS